MREMYCKRTVEMNSDPIHQRSRILRQQSQRKSQSSLGKDQYAPLDLLISSSWYSAVIYKLLGFTAAMVAGPIGTYFLTLNWVFGGM